MNLVIYNINSFGGNYEYVQYLHRQYLLHPEVRNCTLLMPANARAEGANTRVVLSDISTSSNKWARKCYFLYRSFINPLRLFLFLLRQPKSIVLFNDFDQPTASFWAPLFKLFKSHRFAVILHDPDRDHFFPVKALSRSTMTSVMSFMDIAFYHGILPEKPYYDGKFSKIKVPHGIYDSSEIDAPFLAEIKQRANGSAIIGVLGNIREEKNYEIIIRSLQSLKNVKLLVAGQASNSGVSPDHYHELAERCGVSDQLIWVNKYLDQPSFNAAIEACDIVLLYYKPSFTSQSGVLNSIATFHKKLIISDTESSLKECVYTYNLGEVIPHDDVEQLIKTILNLLEHQPGDLKQNWTRYIQEASWERHVAIAVESYKHILG